MLRTLASFVFIFVLCMAHVSGQPVSGRVQTAGHKPLPFVSVALLRDTSFMVGGITNESGEFRLQAPLITGVRYTLKLSLVGYQPLEQLFTWPDTAALAKLVLIRAE